MVTLIYRCGCRRDIPSQSPNIDAYALRQAARFLCFPYCKGGAKRTCSCR